VAAVANGTAVFAVLTLAEVGRLPRDGDVVSPRFGVAPPPGTRRCFDPATGAERPPPDRSTGVNFVPYAGAGGWVGVVGEKAAHPAAAFDLLADLASPARSFELLNDPALGFGPYRTEHLDPAREAVWGRYGFDAERTKRLADALRRFAAVAVVNPAFAPRGPDQAELTAVLAKHVRRAAAGEAAPADAMKQANDEWAAWDAAHPPAAEWRRKSAGLN
jgi:ABC-type glycerol-3-phosphate transport system substrate-binding protein